MADHFLKGDVEISGSLRVGNGITGSHNLDQTIVTPTAVFEIPLQTWKVWNSFGTALPTVGASDDIGLAAGTWGTAIPYLISQDMNAAGAITEYARTKFTLPWNYVTGTTVYLRACHGMLTAAASVANSVDFEAFLCGRSGIVSGSDLVTTSAQTNLTTTLADKDFTLTGTTLVPGSVLDIRITLAVNSATASSHFAIISHTELVCNVR